MELVDIILSEMTQMRKTNAVLFYSCVKKNINKKLIHSLTSCIHKLNQKKFKSKNKLLLQVFVSPFSLYIQTAKLLKGKKNIIHGVC